MLVLLLNNLYFFIFLLNIKENHHIHSHFENHTWWIGLAKKHFKNQMQKFVGYYY